MKQNGGHIARHANACAIDARDADTAATYGLTHNGNVDVICAVEVNFYGVWVQSLVVALLNNAVVKMGFFCQGKCFTDARIVWSKA